MSLGGMQNKDRRSLPAHRRDGHSGRVTDAWRKHRVGLWTMGLIDALLALGVVIVLVSTDEDTDISVLLLSGVLTLAGIVTGFVMLFRTLGHLRWSSAAGGGPRSPGSSPSSFRWR